MSNSLNTQLSSAIGYNSQNIIFSKPIPGSIPNSIPAINYKRVNISTRNTDGSVGELVFCTDELFSFGVNENTNVETGKVNGHVIALCLWNKDAPTDGEKAFTSTFESVVDKCKEYLIQNKSELELYELEMNDLKKFNPLYWKKEKGQIVPGTGPSLYAKLIESKKQDKILSQFYDYEGNEIDPMSLLQKYCYGKFAIKIESIFIGSKISLQVKLYEAQVKVLETGMKRLLTATPRPVSTRQLMPTEAVMSSRHDDETGSLGSDNDEPIVTTTRQPVQQQQPVPVKKVLKKIVRKSDE
jgi:hypothetical protein